MLYLGKLITFGTVLSWPTAYFFNSFLPNLCYIILYTADIWQLSNSLASLAYVIVYSSGSWGFIRKISKKCRRIQTKRPHWFRLLRIYCIYSMHHKDSARCSSDHILYYGNIRTDNKRIQSATAQTTGYGNRGSHLPQPRQQAMVTRGSSLPQPRHRAMATEDPVCHNPDNRLWQQRISSATTQTTGYGNRGSHLPHVE